MHFVEKVRHVPSGRVDIRLLILIEGACRRAAAQSPISPVVTCRQLKIHVMYQLPCGPEITFRCRIDKVLNQYRHLEDTILLFEGSPIRSGLHGHSKSIAERDWTQSNLSMAMQYYVGPKGYSRTRKPLVSISVVVSR